MPESLIVWVAVICAFLAFAIGLSVLTGSLTKQSTAERALTNQGYTHLKLENKDILFVEVKGCGKEDTAKFTFKATNPIGRTVNVEVCEGWPFKGATIRAS